MLLDDNLLSVEGVDGLLTEMTGRRLAVNFSQTLDIYCLTENLSTAPEVDYWNARFNRSRIYFSCNYPGRSLISWRAAQC
jgi:hypothetical protein